MGWSKSGLGNHSSASDSHVSCEANAVRAVADHHKQSAETTERARSLRTERIVDGNDIRMENPRACRHAVRNDMFRWIRICLISHMPLHKLQNDMFTLIMIL